MTRDRWIRNFRPSPDAGRRLVVFPHAGGSASYYHPLPAALTPDTEVLIVQYPGREGRLQDEPITSMDALADATLEALRPWMLDRPVSFFGHSMGALVAFEVIRRMERQGGPKPSGLIVSACTAPSLIKDDGVRLMSDEEVLDEIMQLGGTELDIGSQKDLLRVILKTVRGDLEALETYKAEPGAAVNVPLTIFAANRDPKVTLVKAQTWRKHATAGSEMHVFAGNHFYLMDCRDAFVERLKAVLSSHM